MFKTSFISKVAQQLALLRFMFTTPFNLRHPTQRAVDQVLPPVGDVDIPKNRSLTDERQREELLIISKRSSADQNNIFLTKDDSLVRKIILNSDKN